MDFNSSTIAYANANYDYLGYNAGNTSRYMILASKYDIGYSNLKFMNGEWNEIDTWTDTSVKVSSTNNKFTYLWNTQYTNLNIFNFKSD